METTTTTPQNNDVSGNVIVVNDDSLSNDPITPVASRAIVQEISTSGATPEAAASMLPPTSSSPSGTAMLREWTAAPMQALPNISASPIPPVAPAVLLIQREGSSNSTTSATVDVTGSRTSHSYQYPVATLLTNFVRSVSENVRGEIRDYMPPCNSQRVQVNVEATQSSYATLDAPVTVAITNGNNDCGNSGNNDAVPIIPVASSRADLSTSNNTNSNDENNGNISLIADLEDGNQEWSLIDGELVRRFDYNEDGGLGANGSDSYSVGDISRDDLDYMQKHDRHTSKGSRMHRGVRRLRKLRKLFSGGNGNGGDQKKKGDKNRVIRGESTSRRQQENQDWARNQQDSPNNENYHEYWNRGSEQNVNDDGVRTSTILEATHGRFRRDTASDGDYDSGDGESLIEAPNSYQRNNGRDGDNSTISTKKFHSEEFSIRTGSLRSTFSGPSNNLSPSSSSNNQGQKKRIHRLHRWFRGTTTDSSSSTRSMLSTVSSSSGSMMLRKKRHKQPPSSLNSKDSASTRSSTPNQPRNFSGYDSYSSGGRRGFPPTAPAIDGKPAAQKHVHDGHRGMHPVKEISQELSLNTLPPPSSLATESPLHASNIITDANSDLLGVPSVPLGQDDFQRSSSIAAHASFVCHADSITSEALPDSIAATAIYIEDRLDEYDKYDDKNMKNKDSMKVDKHEGPCIDTMLERAEEIAKDLEASMQEEDAPLKLPPYPAKLTIRKGKSDGESIPLSTAEVGDKIVHNDILKLVLVGDNDGNKSRLSRSLRKSKEKEKLRERTRLKVNVHKWVPSNADAQFSIWEVQTSKSEDPYLPNFGARPGTQSLFFSDQSLYLLVYDLGASNPKTFRQSGKAVEVDSDDECSDDEWDGKYNAYLREEADKKADLALQADMKERVLSWVNCIARRVTHSAILPIALVHPDMSPEETERRCQMMQTLISNYVEKLPSNIVRPKILCGTETVVCVSLHNNMGMGDLERMILEIADASHKVFHHVGRPVPPGTVEIMRVCQDLRKTQKMILVDHLITKLPNKPEFSTEAVMDVLYFLASIGKVLYFGGSDSTLKDYVILSQNWLVSALTCILRNDLQRELSEARQIFKLQSFYSDQQFPESHVTQTFSGNNSSCPILSCQDTQILWQSYNFMMEAVDQSSQYSDTLTTASTKFRFLQHLLEHTGVFLPLEIDRFSTTEKIYFVPSLLSQASARDVWTYKSLSWMVTLCHSWLFRDGAPAGLMEQVTIALLRDLYENSHANAHTPNSKVHKSQPNRHLYRDGEPIGQIKIHQINCWKNSLLVKIGRVFPKGNELCESIIEIFVAITDQVSPHSVASDAMRSNMQRLVVSGKGEVGLHGQKLWKGGYGIVLDSIKASVAHYTNVERQVVCPECLAHRPACSANTWSWDSVLAASDHTVRCMMGHRADRHLICGTAPVISRPEDGVGRGNVDIKPVTDLLPSVVIVGLWDNETKSIRNVGSGFISNKKLGLIVTASHTLFSMDEGRDFGARYKGLNNARAIIGVIPSDKDTAVFRYFAEIVADDIHNMDACILKITSRLENDVDKYSLVGEQPEIALENTQEESLSSLKITSRYEIEQQVRIIGFNQGGEGRLERGNHVNTISDFAKGYICKQFKITDDDSTSSDDSSSSEEGVLKPREEIVVLGCKTIEGHSGGPCVNDDGKVVGILSRSDPVDRERCYLVPSSEIKILISKAKNRVAMGY